jgi:hypothetical protein
MACSARHLRVMGESCLRLAWNGPRPGPRRCLRKRRCHCKGRDYNPQPSLWSFPYHLIRSVMPLEISRVFTTGTQL